MSDKHPDSPSAGISIGDIYFVLFRHKWKILILSSLGVLGAVAMLLAKPAPYQTDAKVRIKFEVDKAGPPGTDTKVRSLEDSPASVIATEIETLKSWDSMLVVATNLTPARILGKPELANEYERAAATVRENLTAEPPSRGSVLTITFQHPDRDLVQSALMDIILAYEKRHAEMNQPLRMSPEAFAQQTNHLREQIAATVAELKNAKTNAGVTSLVDDKHALIDESSSVTKELLSAEADLSAHAGVVEKPAVETNDLVATATNAAPTAASPGDLEDYQRLRSRLSGSKATLDDLIYSRNYQTNRAEVIALKGQIEALKGQIAVMEKEHPELLRVTPPTPGPASPAPGTVIDPGAELRYVHTLHLKIDYLNSKLAQIREAQRKIEDGEAPIRELEQRRDRQEANLNYFLSHYDQTNLGNGFGNDQEAVSLLSSPTPPVKKWSKSFQKKVAMIGLGGIFAGLALAFLIEFVLDRSIKRPVEIENKLRLPLLISIPNVNGNGHRQLAKFNGGKRLLLRDAESPDGAVIVANGNGAAGAKVEIAPWDRRHALHRFYEGLRDRLIVYFEVRNLVHKPKLVAVTSCGKGAGVSTIAAGLAASLSHTGDGNVLLVDMNEEQGSAQQFYKGQPDGCGLETALESGTMKSAHVEGNLYLASERHANGNGNKIQRILPGRLATLMPKLKASEYDYIIFDMPPVSQTSMTSRLSGLMDMVLLVIESEKTNQDVVKRATALLAESKATVSTVLNKTRSYVPAQLHQENLSDS